MNAVQSDSTGENVVTTPYRSVYDTTLTPEDIQKARLELNETPEARLKALEALRKLLLKEKHLHPRLDEDFLIRFLRARKFDVGAAFETVKKHHRFQRQHPGLFRCPSEVIQFFRDGVFKFVPFRDTQGRMIYILKPGLWDPEKAIYEDLCAAIYVAAELAISNPVNQINGFICIIDYQGVGFRHVMATPINDIKRLLQLIQGCCPARFKKVYVINIHPIVHALIEVGKLFLKKKIKDRITFTNKLSDLSEGIDRQLLPVEYGGEAIFGEEIVIQKLMESNSEIERDRKIYGYSNIE